MPTKQKPRQKPISARHWVIVFESFASALRDLEGKAAILAEVMRCGTPLIVKPPDLRDAALRLAFDIQAQRMRAADLSTWVETQLPPPRPAKAAKKRG